MKFRCASCGFEHDDAEISFGADAPVQWRLLSEAERTDSVLSGEQCEIQSAEGWSFYIRACLEVPVQGSDRRFTWGVWCSLSEKNYVEMAEHWTDPDRTRLGPYFGWLCSKLPEYPDTMFLKTQVVQRQVGTRPLVLLEPTDHPLAIDQRDGIEAHRLQHVVQRILHEEEGKRGGSARP